jgi:hypothetical protein
MAIERNNKEDKRTKKAISSLKEYRSEIIANGI